MSPKEEREARTELIVPLRKGAYHHRKGERL
jgi:hypothetical protein